MGLGATISRALPERVKLMLYRLPIVTGAIRGALNFAAPPGLTEVRVTGGSLAGAILRLDLKREKYYWLGTDEPELQRAIKELVTPGMTVYDVGANIGYFSLLLAAQVGNRGLVYAFEPLPSSIERPRDHVALNGQLSLITIVDRAVSDNCEEASFLIHGSHAMGKLEGSAGRDATYDESIEVASVSLDEFVFELGNPPPDVVKMDIEGGEVKAIPGMLRVLKERSPILLLELHGPESAQIVWDVLEDCSYQVYRLVSGYPEIESREALPWKARILGSPNADSI